MNLGLCYKPYILLLWGVETTREVMLELRVHGVMLRSLTPGVTRDPWYGPDRRI